MRGKILVVVTLFPATMTAQVMPTLSDTSPYTLTLPYLEYVAAGSATKAGFAVNLKSSNLATFVLDATSLKTQVAFTNAANAPQLSVSGTQFLLTIPYLSFTSGGVTKAFSLTFTSADLLTYSPLISSIKDVAILATPTSVSVANVSARTVGITAFSSSTKLAASWKAPTGYTPDHYRIYASEGVGNTNVSITALATDTSATLTGLKSSTNYAVVIRACKDVACLEGGSAPVVTAKTSDEVWQLQGTSGATSDAVTRLTSDSNTLNYALAYGDWADSSLRGKIRYFYNPLDNTVKGVKTALSTAAASAADVGSVTSFDLLSGYGIVAGSGSTPTSGPVSIGQMQAVPFGGKVRLFMEARGADDKNRIYSLDSADGYVGIDYNPGTGTKCDMSANDLAAGGACSPQVALGLTGDGFSTKGVSAFRQMKVLYPTQSTWLWDGVVNTPMVVTLDLDHPTATSCAKYQFTQGWALWSGSKWELQYASNGICPKLFDGMQAPAPVHLGDGRYKLYFSNNVTPNTQIGFSFDNKPVKVIYGTASGNLITFEDFETVTQARDLTFLWPDGSVLPLFTSASAGGEAKFDDYTMFAPTGSLDFQVMYTNFSGGSKGSFTAAALLLNP